MRRSVFLAVLAALVVQAVSISFDLPSGKVGDYKADIIPAGQNRMPVEVQADNPLTESTVSLCSEEESWCGGEEEALVSDPMEKVSDPMEKVLYTQDDVSTGRFAFTSSVAGDYIVCFHNKGLSEFQTQRRAMLDLKHGIDAKDYTQ
ncbi:hypothetical protein T484DRAFT_1808817, partial [Baffinella frigidus]